MPAEPDEVGEGERLQKVLARAGLGSRRVCDDLIASGRVSVDGEQARLGQRIDPVVHRVAVDGVPLAIAPGLVHYVLNKPAGVICSAADPEGRPQAVDLVPAQPRVFSVGRLDTDSEGLLLLTNDGELAHRLTHPSYGVDKEYLVEVEGQPTSGALGRLRRGVDLSDGPTAPARVGVVAPGVLRIVVHEGRNRQVRRMCEAVGHPVRRLVRVRIGPIADQRLAPGAWRPLTQAEVRDLAAATGSRTSARGASGRGGAGGRGGVGGRGGAGGRGATGGRGAGSDRGATGGRGAVGGRAR